MTQRLALGPEAGSSQQSKHWMCYLTPQGLSRQLDQLQQQTATAAATAGSRGITATPAAAATDAQRQRKLQQEQLHQLQQQQQHVECCCCWGYCVQTPITDPRDHETATILQPLAKALLDLPPATQTNANPANPCLIGTADDSNGSPGDLHRTGSCMLCMQISVLELG